MELNNEKVTVKLNNGSLRKEDKVLIHKLVSDDEDSLLVLYFDEDIPADKLLRLVNQVKSITNKECIAIRGEGINISINSKVKIIEQLESMIEELKSEITSPHNDTIESFVNTHKNVSIKYEENTINNCYATITMINTTNNKVLKKTLDLSVLRSCTIPDDVLRTLLNSMYEELFYPKNGDDK